MTKEKAIDMLTPEEENQKYTLPCPRNSLIVCVQYPDDGCGCDWCEDCTDWLDCGTATDTLRGNK